MRSDRPLMISVLLLAAGLGTMFGYGDGTAGFSAAYPAAGANLHLAITTTGPAAMGGFAMTLVGLVVLIWALVCAIVGQIQLIGSAERLPERAKGWAPKELSPKS